MSYIRSTSVYKYVNEKNSDYIFPSSAVDSVDYVEDYGGISNACLVDFFFRMLNDNWRTDDELLKAYMLKRLSEKLKVKTYKKPLSQKQMNKKVLDKFNTFKKDSLYDDFFNH